MTNVVTSKVGKYRTIEKASHFIISKLHSPTGARAVTSFLSAKAKAGEHMFLKALKEYMLHKSLYGNRSEEQVFQKTLEAFEKTLESYVEKAAQ